MSALPGNCQQPLGWTSTPDDFKTASEEAIIQRYDEVSAVRNARRVSETVLVKKCSPREYKNQAFASDIFNHDRTPLWVPKVFRYIQGCSESGDGYLVMEFLDGSAWLDRCDSATNKRVLKAVRYLHDRTSGAHIPGPPDGELAEGFPWGRDWRQADFSFKSMTDVLDLIKHKLRLRALRTASKRVEVEFLGNDLVLCHGSLEQKNIIILGNRRVAILGWKWLCFYPVVFELACLSTIWLKQSHEGQQFVLDSLILHECKTRSRQEIESEIEILRITEEESLSYSVTSNLDGWFERFVGNKSTA